MRSFSSGVSPSLSLSLARARLRVLEVCVRVREIL